MNHRLKKALKSRRKFSQADKKMLYKKWRTSGLGKSEFCKAHKLSVSTFCGWGAQLGASMADPNWIAVKPTGDRGQGLPSEELQICIRVSSEILLEMNLSVSAAVALIESLTHATAIIR